MSIRLLPLQSILSFAAILLLRLLFHWHLTLDAFTPFPLPILRPRLLLKLHRFIDGRVNIDALQIGRVLTEGLFVVVGESFWRGGVGIALGRSRFDLLCCRRIVRGFR